jgi:hypothetical protein
MRFKCPESSFGRVLPHIHLVNIALYHPSRVAIDLQGIFCIRNRSVGFTGTEKKHYS